MQTCKGASAESEAKNTELLCGIRAILREKWLLDFSSRHSMGQLFSIRDNGGSQTSREKSFLKPFGSKVCFSVTSFTLHQVSVLVTASVKLN